MTENNHDCAYQENQLRCRYPGAISNGTTGAGPWFCRIHARERGTQLAHQCLDESQTWIPRPAQENLAWLDQNFPTLEGETQQEYNLRCRDFALRGLKGFRLKPVVSSGLKLLQEQDVSADVRSGELVEF